MAITAILTNCFQDNGEQRLTEWMRKHLEIGVCSLPKGLVAEREDDLIADRKPMLNLKGGGHPAVPVIKMLRARCRKEALEHKQ